MPDRRLVISRAHWDQMRHHVEINAPLEACGLVAGRAGTASAVMPVTNALQSPIRFRMDAQAQLLAFEQIEAAGQDILAIFHSHPHGPAVPSPTDLAEAAYPVVNLIWMPVNGRWTARGYWIDAGAFTEIELEVVE